MCRTSPDITEEKVHKIFDPLIAHHQPAGGSYRPLRAFPIGTPPSSVPIVGTVSAADIASDPSMTWMQNKIIANAPADAAGPASQSDAISNFLTSIVDRRTAW